jgi:hypothetical protein
MKTPTEHLRRTLLISQMLCFLFSMILPDPAATIWFVFAFGHSIVSEKLPLY